MWKCQRLCLGCIPVHFFCRVIPVRRSMDILSVCTIILFAWNLVVSCVMLATVAGLRNAYGVGTPQMYTGLSLNSVAALAMICSSLLLAWRGTHLIWLTWAILCFLIQGIALAVVTVDDAAAISKQYLVIFTTSRMLASLNLYFMWLTFVFTWSVVLYFWLCVFSSYQVMRLPKNYEAILEEELKDDYEKKRENVANAVYQQMVNERYLHLVKKFKG